MAVPVSSWSNAMSRLAPRLSETMVNASNNSLLKAAGLRSMSTVIKRPQTANPAGWSRKSANVSKSVPLDMQHGGSSPSGAYLKSVKSGPKAPSSSSDGVKMNLYDRLLAKCSPRTGITKFKPPKAQPPEKFSLPISTFQKKTLKNVDREDEQFYATDQAPSTSGHQSKKQAATKSQNLVGNANSKVYDATSVNDSQSSEPINKVSCLKEREGYVTSVTDNIDTSFEDIKDPQRNISTNKDLGHKEEVIEFTKENESLEDSSGQKESKLSRNVPPGYDGSNPIYLKEIRNTDWASSSQRSVDINLNELEGAKSDNKKTLSMDINVIVSVKPQDSIKKPEIGFQELPENKEDRSVTIVKHIAQNDKYEKLRNNSRTRYLSQKDLTEEIGKVYNFLKNNEKIQTAPKGNNPNSFDVFQNFEKIKDLYFNALRCVKAFKELRCNISENVKSKEKDLSEHALVVHEVENCCKSNSAISAREYNSYKYPIDFNKNEESTDNHYTESGQSSTGQSGQFLALKPPGLMNVRMYSSDSGTKASDCEKAKKLPCLQSSELSSQKEATASSRSVCDKLCMPCCKPARDPPVCFYPYHKPPCKKQKPPRPAFSECKHLFELRQVVPCECVRPRATSCKKSPESETCDKR